MLDRDVGRWKCKANKVNIVLLSARGKKIISLAQRFFDSTGSLLQCCETLPSPQHRCLLFLLTHVSLDSFETRVVFRNTGARPCSSPQLPFGLQ